MSDHPDFAAEQAHIERAYACLEDARASTLRIRDLTEAQMGGTFQERYERNYFDEKVVARLNKLDIGDAALVFGRIDRTAEDLDSESTEAFHIGRLAVADREANPVVVDWRAPVAEPFYRATGREPMGLVRRRHFMVEGPRLLAIEDESFGDGRLGLAGDESVGDAPTLRGQGTLLAALGKGRTGQLGDIVATIQSEQDEIIRAPHRGVLVVQGGPGTGKTVVALHRAAYLLYTHRFPLEDQGVLVIGPNRVFLRYIERVLPSLGETGIQQVVLADLVPGITFGAHDDDVARRVKADRRMVNVLERAIADRQRPIREDVMIPFGATRLRLTPRETAGIIRQARRRGGRHNTLCRAVEGEVIATMMSKVGDGTFDLAEARDGLRQIPEFRALMFRMWPSLTAAELLHDLFGSKALLQSAGEGVLSHDEALALHRPRAESLAAARFSDGDVALLDEARELLGARPRRGGVLDEADDIATYGHIIVDEAQDLTPMQLRMVARRSLNGAMTVVGDLAQATGAFAANDWSELIRVLSPRKEVTVVNLTVGYRIPRQIMDLASGVVREALPSAIVPTAVREGDAAPRIIAAANRDALVGAVVDEASRLAAELPAGRVGVICPDDVIEAVAQAMRDAGVTFGRATSSGLEERITVVPVGVAKGLELDGIIVVEPAAMARAVDVGLRGLYVALTRATQRLSVVHHAELPAAMRNA
jgi:DNA helicase IV